MKILEQRKFDSKQTIRAHHDGMNFVFKLDAIQSGEPQAVIGAYVDMLNNVQLVILSSHYGILIQQTLKEVGIL